MLKQSINASTCVSMYVHVSIHIFSYISNEYTIIYAGYFVEFAFLSFLSLGQKGERLNVFILQKSEIPFLS